MMKPVPVIAFLEIVFVSFLGQASPATNKSEPLGEHTNIKSTSEMQVAIKYTREGGHAPGNYSVTIQGGEAEIVTPGRPPVLSRMPVASDEVEYFRALFHLGDFFNVPAFQSTSSIIIVDRPVEELMLTVNGKSHTADCTNTNNPYLRNILELFREMIRKQEVIILAETAMAAQTQPSEQMPRFLQWQAPLRAQREKASNLMNELLDNNRVYEVIHCNASGIIDLIAALANSRTIEILTAKIEARDRDYLYAVDALGNTDDPRAIPPLLNLMAEGDHDPRIILALAKLGCRAVLDEAMAQKNIEALGYIGWDNRNAISLVEDKAYGWFTERSPRSVAVQALARMKRLPTPTKANLLAHLLAGLMILTGISVLIAPRAMAHILCNAHRCYLVTLGIACSAAGCGVFYMLHFSIFF